MYQPVILPHFHKILSRHSKKYRRLAEAVADALDNFHKEKADSLGGGLYKFRLRSPDVNRGKNKSFRLILLVMEVESYVVPVTLYFKGDRGDISQKELNDELDLILFELKLRGLTLR